MSDQTRLDNALECFLHRARMAAAVRVMLAQPRGFCAGVIRAIDIVEQALRSLARRSTSATRSFTTAMSSRACAPKARASSKHLSEVPAGAITIFSAHGVARIVEDDAQARGLRVLDATCPLVAKVHGQGKRYVAARPPGDPGRPRGPSRGRGHDGPDTGAGAARANRARRRRARSRCRYAGRLHHADDAQRRRYARGHRRARSAASPTSSGRTSTTSAMRRRTGSRPCASSPRSPT